MQSTISFPGFGIGEFTVNTIAFTIFGRSITWYGIIVTLGIICGFLYALRRSRTEKIIADDLLDFAIYGVIFGVIGARLYYVIMKRDSYHNLYDIGRIFQRQFQCLLVIIQLEVMGNEPVDTVFSVPDPLADLT